MSGEPHTQAAFRPGKGLPYFLSMSYWDPRAGLDGLEGRKRTCEQNLWSCNLQTSHNTDGAPLCFVLLSNF